MDILPVTFSINFNTFFNKKFIVFSYISGLSVGLTVSSCTTPILFTIASWLNQEPWNLKKFISIFAYSVGYTLPFLLIFTIFKNIIAPPNKLGNIFIFSIIGVWLISFGIYNLLDIFFLIVTKTL